MPWPEHWTHDRLNADPLSKRLTTLARGQKAYIGIPDSVGINPYYLSVVSINGVRFWLDRLGTEEG